MSDEFGTEDAIHTIKIVGIIAFGIAVIVVGLALFTAGFQKPLFDIQRNAIKSSHGYVETKQTQLMQMEEEWRKLATEMAETSDVKIQNLKKSQQLYLETRMRMEANRINEKEIPESIWEIIGRR